MVSRKQSRMFSELLHPWTENKHSAHFSGTLSFWAPGRLEEVDSFQPTHLVCWWVECRWMEKFFSVCEVSSGVQQSRRSVGVQCDPLAVSQQKGLFSGAQQRAGISSDKCPAAGWQGKKTAEGGAQKPFFQSLFSILARGHTHTSTHTHGDSIMEKTKSGCDISTGREAKTSFFSLFAVSEALRLLGSERRRDSAGSDLHEESNPPWTSHRFPPHSVLDCGNSSGTVETAFPFRKLLVWSNFQPLLSGFKWKDLQCQPEKNACRREETRFRLLTVGWTKVSLFLMLWHLKPFLSKFILNQNFRMCAALPDAVLMLFTSPSGQIWTETKRVGEESSSFSASWQFPCQPKQNRVDVQSVWRKERFA